MNEYKEMERQLGLAIVIGGAIAISALICLCVGKALACDSYEDCMKEEKFLQDDKVTAPSPIWNKEDRRLIAINKAIAYKLDDMQKRQEIYYNNVANEQRMKLDEISKKLESKHNIKVSYKGLCDSDADVCCNIIQPSGTQFCLPNARKWPDPTKAPYEIQQEAGHLTEKQ